MDKKRLLVCCPDKATTAQKPFHQIRQHLSCVTCESQSCFLNSCRWTLSVFMPKKIKEKKTVRTYNMQTWPKIGYFGNHTINFSVPLCHQIYYHFAMHSTCLGCRSDRAGTVPFNLRANEMRLLFISCLFSLRLFCILNLLIRLCWYQHSHSLAHNWDWTHKLHTNIG